MCLSSCWSRPLDLRARVAEIIILRRSVLTSCRRSTRTGLGSRWSTTVLPFAAGTRSRSRADEVSGRQADVGTGCVARVQCVREPLAQVALLS